MPSTMNRRLMVIDTVRDVFARYGFEPLETPAERIETLTGKYGDEGEKLMFRILKRGDGGKRGEVDQALRYDLTVPLARGCRIESGLPLPFKRSQIQPVWRADRPQGRFREFYQCDVDTITYGQSHSRCGVHRRGPRCLNGAGSDGLHHPHQSPTNTQGARQRGCIDKEVGCYKRSTSSTRLVEMVLNKK